MGCDIHAAIEVSDGNGWKAVKFPNPWYGKYKDERTKTTARLAFDRDYNAFAILADVRNGSGFAGIDTGDGFQPMSVGRGLPEDITAAGKKVCSGDHSDTYVDFEEMQAYDWTQSTTHRGLVTAEVFEKWDRVKEYDPRPSQWCGDVGGSSVKIISEDDMRQRLKAFDKLLQGSSRKEYVEALEKFLEQEANTYCKISWRETYAISAGELWTKWFPMMLALSQKHERVRMVMNFDS
jgi:hypothetical protein